MVEKTILTPPKGKKMNRHTTRIPRGRQLLKETPVSGTIGETGAVLFKRVPTTCKQNKILIYEVDWRTSHVKFGRGQKEGSEKDGGVEGWGGRVEG